MFISHKDLKSMVSNNEAKSGVDGGRRCWTVDDGGGRRRLMVVDLT